MDQKSPEAFRTISEVAEWLDTPAHVLRFWESRFTQVKPVKRAGGRRYYRPADMALLGGIKKLLHEDGMTIRGVQKILRSEGVRHVAALSPPLDDLAAPAAEQSVSAGAEAASAPPARPEPAAGEADAAPAAEAEREPRFSFGSARAAPGATPPDGPDGEFAHDLVAPLGEEPRATPAPAPESPPAASPVAPPASARPDLAAIPDVPPDDDKVFAARPSGFPLRDPRAARARLAAQPATAAALYARLLALRERIGEGRR